MVAVASTCSHADRRPPMSTGMASGNSTRPMTWFVECPMA